MKTFNSILIIVLTALFCWSCQQSQYTIQGTTSGLADGDTLVLTNDMTGNTSLQKTVVKDGGFEFKGEVDSVSLCVIYVDSRPDVSINFFLEPAELKVHLSADAAESTVGGTKANEAWQSLNSKTAAFNAKMQHTMERLYSQELSEEENKRIVSELKAMEKEMVEHIVATAEQNIDNETGYFIATHFEDDNYFTTTKRIELIQKLPKAYRDRPEVNQLLEQLQRALTTEKGNKLPEFSLPDADGNSVSVAEIIGRSKLTIIDFWASWCGPCRQEMPSMVKLYEAYHEQGLEIVGISLDEDKSAWQKAVKEMGMKWPQLSDLKGWQSAAAELFHVKAIPLTIVIDSNGTILAKGLRGEMLQQAVAEQLQQ